MLHTAELVSSIFARCCETPEHQVQIAASGAIPLLMRLLVSGVSKSQESALGALAALVKDNTELARHIAQTRSKSSVHQQSVNCTSFFCMIGMHRRKLKNNQHSKQMVVFACLVEKGERPAPYILRLVRDKSPTMRLAAVTWYVDGYIISGETWCIDLVQYSMYTDILSQCCSIGSPWPLA